MNSSEKKDYMQTPLNWHVCKTHSERGSAVVLQNPPKVVCTGVRTTPTEKDCMQSPRKGVCIGGLCNSLKKGVKSKSPVK